MNKQLQDRVAVITGGASGMGEASVIRFLDEGAFVFVVDRSGHEAEIAQRLGERAIAFHADVTSAEELQRLFKAVDEKFGRLDVLFNNAGTGGRREDVRALSENTDQHIEDMLAINVKSVLFAIKYALPLMIKTGKGSIINTSSTSGLMAQLNMAAYSAAKAGVIGLTRTLALEVGAKGIRVNSICPGPINTPLLKYYMQDEALREHLVNVTAMKRLGEPDEIAKVALFLASDASSYVTGVSIPVDGGQSA
jgi:NAD(P)-dependent dehydrogenase (short-subunit alcohol dehydrogenase family)